MRIALVSTPFVAVPPPAYGGTELVVHALARALGRAGHEVVLFATGDSHGADVRAFFETPVWPPDPYAELLHCRFAARQVAEEGFDVVHVHSPAALAFAEDMGAPVVYTLHHERDERLARYYAHAPEVIRVAISDRQAELETPAPDHVVHHGLEPDLYPAEAAAADGGYAVCLGRLSWCKGPELAVEAARLAGLPLVVAGSAHRDGGAPPRWEEEVLAPALRAPHVRWLRRANLAAKRRLLVGARALLVPIRWEEPFGLVMIEAMMAGCPVIAFRRGAAPEVVEEGVTGHLVDDVAGMAAALRTAEGFDRAACRAGALERFSSDRMAREYLAIYRAAILRQGGPRAAPRLSAAPGEDGWTTLAT